MGEVLMFVIVELFGPWERKLFIGPKKKLLVKKSNTSYSTDSEGRTHVSQKSNIAWLQTNVHVK